MASNLTMLPFYSYKSMQNFRFFRTTVAMIQIGKKLEKLQNNENSARNASLLYGFKRNFQLKNFLFGGLPASIVLFSNNISTPLLLKHYSRRRIPKDMLTGRKSRIKSDTILAKFCTKTAKPVKPAKPNVSCVRPNINPEVAKMINQQIGHEYQAGYDYLAISLHFGRNDIALVGCERFYYDMYLEEMEHSRIFMRYLNMRGGQTTLFPIAAPKIILPKNILSALDLSIQMENRIKDTLVKLLQVATKNQDYSLEDMLTNFFILEQEKSISGLTRLMSRFKRMDPDCGLSTYLFDDEMGKTADMRQFENENFGPYKSLHDHEKSGL